jgi:hypothetical protein
MGAILNPVDGIIDRNLVLPERICSLDMSDLNKPQDMLSVGLTFVTKNAYGLNIAPVKEVAFAIGKTIGNAEERAFTIPVSMARRLAGRIVEMCDIAEN